MNAPESLIISVSSFLQMDLAKKILEMNDLAKSDDIYRMISQKHERYNVQTFFSRYWNAFFTIYRCRQNFIKAERYCFSG